MTAYARTTADRFRWYWKLQSRIDSLQVRWTGTSLLALMLRSRVLLLETTGRRSGRRRRVPVMYWRDGSDVFIGGGAAGMTRVDWVANVRIEPRATAWLRRRRFPVLIHELKDAEYEDARREAFERWPRAARYERSGRPIPYFRLEILAEAETALPSETKVIAKRGSMVLRDAGPHSATVHALLRYLGQRGFDGAPRVLGSGFDEAGRETLSFIEGDQLDPNVPTEAQAHAIGARLRELHDLTERFEAPDDALWQPWFGRSIGEPRLVGHCDAAPWNVVFSAEGHCALVDWEAAGPVDPLVDLAHAAWLNPRLFSDDIAVKENLPSLSVRARVLRSLLDGYRLRPSQRPDLFDLIVEVAIHSVAAEADEGDVGPETERSRALWGMAWRARSAAWLLANREAILRELS